MHDLWRELQAYPTRHFLYFRDENAFKEFFRNFFDPLMQGFATHKVQSDQSRLLLLARDFDSDSIISVVNHQWWP